MGGGALLLLPPSPACRRPGRDRVREGSGSARPPQVGPGGRSPAATHGPAPLGVLPPLRLRPQVGAAGRTGRPRSPSAGAHSASPAPFKLRRRAACWEPCRRRRRPAPPPRPPPPAVVTRACRPVAPAAAAAAAPRRARRAPCRRWPGVQRAETLFRTPQRCPERWLVVGRRVLLRSGVAFWSSTGAALCGAGSARLGCGSSSTCA